MHRCVCVYLTVHITKLQLQTTFPKPLYIPHSAELLVVAECELLVVAEGSRKLPKHYHATQWVHAYIHVHLLALCGEYTLSLLLILISKYWRCHPWAGHAFPRQRHMRRGGSYLFLPGFSSLYDVIHGWMTGWMDGWMDESCDEKASQKMTMTSFTICNAYVEGDTSVHFFHVLFIWLWRTSTDVGYRDKFFKNSFKLFLNITDTPCLRLNRGLWVRI